MIQEAIDDGRLFKMPLGWGDGTVGAVMSVKDFVDGGHEVGARVLVCVKSVGDRRKGEYSRLWASACGDGMS